MYDCSEEMWRVVSYTSTDLNTIRIFGLELIAGPDQGAKNVTVLLTVGGLRETDPKSNVLLSVSTPISYTLLRVPILHHYIICCPNISSLNTTLPSLCLLLAPRYDGI